MLGRARFREARLGAWVFFTAARKRDRQPAEFCPTSVNSTECELRAVDVTDATSKITFLTEVLFRRRHRRT